MVSESNFVLGINQTSLHSKEDLYMHSTDSQCLCLSLDLDPMTSHSSHESLLLSCHYVSDHSLSNSCLPF